MEYISRDLERKFNRMNEFFKVVLVTGARQVGKTTMLKHLSENQNRTYVTLDNTMARHLAKTDPGLFFQTYKPPVIIDEVQYAPELFGQIKIICDDINEPGLFWLTGSQQYQMMKNVRESLAGRIGILNLYSMSQSEIDKVFFDDDLDFSFACLSARQAKTTKNDVIHVFEHIWRGGMPQILYADAEQRHEYFQSYINSYLMRDVVESGGIKDTLRFINFTTACATLISEQINYKTLADAVGISQPTAKEWLGILEGLGIVFLLKPYANKVFKRLAKTPKLYFCDTGFAAHLSLWPTAEILMNGAANGRFFENHVVNNLLKYYSYSQTNAEMTYFRDSNTKEIDILVERNTVLHPLEIKKSANPDSREIKKFTELSKTTTKQGSGGIICLCDEVVPIDQKNSYIPCNLI